MGSLSSVDSLSVGESVSVGSFDCSGSVVSGSGYTTSKSNFSKAFSCEGSMSGIYGFSSKS